MNGITVGRDRRVRVDGTAWGYVSKHDGTVYAESVDASDNGVVTVTGSVERVEYAGPHGGDRVEWRAYGHDGRDMGAHDTRTEAVVTIVRAWDTDAVEAPERVNLPDGPCPDCGESVTYDGVAPMHSTTGDAECDALPESNGAPLGAVARAALDALSGETDVHWTPTGSGTGDVSAVVWERGNGGNRNVFRVGVFMSDAGTVFNGMDGAGDYCHMVTDDADAAVSFIRNHLGVTAPECVVCGEPVDYCPGHGADNYAAYVWACHDADYHGACRASCRTEGARGVLIVSREYDPDTDVYCGDVHYADTYADWHPDVSVLDAVDLLRGEHLTTSADAHGPEVWTEGDARGQNVHHYTGTVTETEAYMRGYTDAECAVTAALATGEPWECGGVTVTGVGFRVWDVDADEVDADNVPWFRRDDYPDADADDAARFIPLSDGDVLPLGEVMALRHTFAPGAEVMEPDNVHRVLHGASTDSAWSGYGVIYDHDDNTWSVVRMTW